jgi:opacity protein-like surface antigen
LLFVFYVAEKIDYMGTLRGRVGYAFPHWMIYAAGGFAWSLVRFLQTPGVIDDTDKALHLYTGWAVGAGADVAIAPNWTARLEYLYRSFGHADIVLPSGTSAESSFDIQYEPTRLLGKRRVVINGGLPDPETPQAAPKEPGDKERSS